MGRNDGLDSLNLLNELVVIESNFFIVCHLDNFVRWVTKTSSKNREFILRKFVCLISYLLYDKRPLVFLGAFNLIV